MSQKQHDLTPKKAWQEYHEDNRTLSEIAEDYDVSTSTVGRYKRQWEETKDTALDAAEQAIKNEEIRSSITDEEPDENPYDMVSCPSCGDDIKTPDSAGKSDCPECGKTLNWSEDEI